MSRRAAIIAALAVLGGAAHAQQIMVVQQPYPYVAPQPQYAYPAPQPQYAPGYAPEAYPYTTPQRPRHVARYHRKPKANPALAEELRKERHVRHHAASQRHESASADAGKSADRADATPEDKKKYSKTVVVRDKPVVRNHYRVVDDPPVVVRREINEDGTVASVTPLAPMAQGGGVRVIHAEAEVTILGPDRMNIRLYRKRDGLEANAKASGKTKKN